MGKSSGKSKESTKDSRDPRGNQSQQKNNRGIKKRGPQKDKSTSDTKKIHYVLNPKKIKEKMIEIKESERREKEKTLKAAKGKRNAVFSRKTSKGQPKLNDRMKLLYNQIQKSCGSGSSHGDPK